MSIFLKADTGLKYRGNIPVIEGDLFEYKSHLGYSLPDFKGKVVWVVDYACYGYTREDLPNWWVPTPFCLHDELNFDFLSHCKLIKRK